MKTKLFFAIILSSFCLTRCQTDPAVSGGKTGIPPTPYTLIFPPDGMKPVPFPENPITIEGVYLGKKLFYDVRLSENNTQSCGSCHQPDFGFTDKGLAFSKGIDGIVGNRNSMPIFNLAWEKSFFWDGRSPDLEHQSLQPIQNPIEMHSTLPKVIQKLQVDPEYGSLFEKAFGSNEITSQRIAYAISQFERTIISFQSPFDKRFPKTTDVTRFLLRIAQDTSFKPKDDVERGMLIFFSDTRPNSGHCWHCHGNGPANNLYTDRMFHNNGLPILGNDTGRMAVTGNPADFAYFKTPSLRNLAFTAPYMHDGRFKSIEEVIEHYTQGVVFPPQVTKDANLARDFGKPLNLNIQDKKDLKAFLLSLTDSVWYKNSAYRP